MMPDGDPQDEVVDLEGVAVGCVAPAATGWGDCAPGTEGIAPARQDALRYRPGRTQRMASGPSWTSAGIEIGKWQRLLRAGARKL